MQSHSLDPISPRDRLADRVVRPFLRFMKLEVSSALLLIAMTVIALVWANSPWGESYSHFWHTPVALTIGNLFQLELSLGHWVNDGLMVIFFFVVGMEIKRELVLGELSTRARAMLPVAGALGGMVVPALIYTYFHVGEETIRGWGVPMATDIAFAVAALSLLGSRVPSGLRVFLLALAIADDLGAVAVIAIFYTAELNLNALAYAGAGLFLCLLLNKAGVRSLFVYLVVGCFVWFETHHSGVHATVAGVLLGFLTPTNREHENNETLIDAGRHAIEQLRIFLSIGSEPKDLSGHGRHQMLQRLEIVGRGTLSPLDYLVNRLEPWVAFVIMPLFALANAGVVLEASTLADPLGQKVALGVCLGLLFGKPIGITVFAWVAVKGRIAVLPRGVSWLPVFATGVLAGIGFTVALFVTLLAFQNEVHIAGAKVGILVGSFVAAVVGLLILYKVLPQREESIQAGR